MQTDGEPVATTWPAFGEFKALAIRLYKALGDAAVPIGYPAEIIHSIILRDSLPPPIGCYG